MQTKYEFDYAISSAAAGTRDSLEAYQKDGWECISITNRQGLYGNEFVIFLRRPLR